MGNSGSKKIYVWKLPSRACCLKNFVIQLPFAWVSLLANGNRLPCWEHLEGILRYCRGAGRTAIAVDARRPINWLSSLMEADDFHSRSSQSSLLSLGEGSVSFLLSWLPYPKIVYFDMVRVLIFCDLSKNPDSEEDISNVQNRPQGCIFFSPTKFKIPFDEAISSISSRKIISLTYSFLNRERELSSTLWISLGLVPNQSRGKGTGRTDPFIWNLKTLGILNLVGLKNMHPWGLFCTFSPLPVMFLSRGITLPFWNGSTECNN